MPRAGRSWEEHCPFIVPFIAFIVPFIALHSFIPILAVIALLLVKYFLNKEREGWAFIMTGIAIIFSTVTIFLGLFPRLMVSSLNPEWSLTIYNASASQYTLKVMSIVAVGLLPFILTYQAWSYWVFRKRITVDSTLVY